MEIKVIRAQVHGQKMFYSLCQHLSVALGCRGCWVVEIAVSCTFRISNDGIVMFRELKSFQLDTPCVYNYSNGLGRIRTSYLRVILMFLLLR